MLTYAGREAHEIYKTLPWTEPDDKMKFDKVVKAFRDYCHPCKNILYEQHKFWSLKQEDGESVDAYNTRLKVQIDHYDYEREGWPEAVKTEMIRDKFVFRICDDKLKKRLLRETYISLSKLVGLAQRTEFSKQHIREMTGATTKSMDTIHKNSKQNEIVCGQCDSKHRPKECPAFGQQCSTCHKLHHFAKVCRNKCQFAFKNKQTPNSKNAAKKRVHVLDQDDNFSVAEDKPEIFIDAIQVHGVSESSWLAAVSTEGGKITFKLDTGAEACVLPLKVHKRLNNRQVINHTTVKLSPYGGSVIKPVGTCTLKCKGKISSAVTFYVVFIAIQPILD